MTREVEDCISRAYIEPIIEELENICVNGDEHILDLLADIKNAPPVTPPQPCEDAISRQAAIDAVGLCRVPSHIKERIAKLPPVTPQQRTGRWEYRNIANSIVVGHWCDN